MNDLEKFLEKNSKSVDIFCFQEVYNGESYSSPIKLSPNHNLFSEMEIILKNYDGYFRPHYKTKYGLAIFVKKDLKVLKKEEDIFIYKEKDYIPKGEQGNHARNIQSIVVEKEGRKYSIFNFHGLWNGKGKNDSRGRIIQSENIKKYLLGFEKGTRVLCGDFNLLPETTSVKILEDIPLLNLIKKYNIIDTRTSYYKKDVRYADYILIDEGILEKNFLVMKDEVSDHAALFLEI